MTCRLFSTKPLSQPVLGYCQFDSYEQSEILIKIQLFFFHGNASENIVCEIAAIVSLGGVELMNN